MIYSKRIKSPVGDLTLVSTKTSLLAINWGKGNKYKQRFCQILNEAEVQLSEYFSGRRRGFALPVALEGTHFQKNVWDALMKIPYGETRTYREVARFIGKSGAVRAVGSACGRNPIPIIIPCHRVIGAKNELVGFTGGICIKKFLLNLEKGV